MYKVLNIVVLFVLMVTLTALVKFNRFIGATK
jgi:hypothetical protein